VSNQVALLSEFYEASKKLIPEATPYSWLATADDASVELYVEKFIIPANQSADLTLNMQFFTTAEVVAFSTPSKDVDGNIKVKINGDTAASEARAVSDRLILNEAITALTVTNADTAASKELFVFQVVPVGTVASTTSKFSVVGAKTFLELIDTPSSYAGAASKRLGINSAGNAVVVYDQIGDGGNLPIQTRSTDGNASATAAIVLVDASAGDVTLTLPDSASGRKYEIVKIDSTFNKVIVTPASGDIKSASSPSGTTTFNMVAPFETIGVITDATDWFVI
jgi:hypothetical protein